MRTIVALVMLALPGLAWAQTEEQRFLELINEYRVQHGLTRLVITPKLTRSALWMSNDMAEHDYINHTDSQGRDPFRRMDDLGYNFNTIRGENLAAGQRTAEEAFNGWRNSPGHNANMLKPEYRAIGIARIYRPGGDYRYYWTTNFGGYVDGVGGPPTTDPKVSPRAPAPSAARSRAESPVEEARRFVRENEPISSLGVFMGTSFLTDGLLLGVPGVGGRILRTALPVGAAIAAVHVAQGNLEPRDIIISAGAYTASGLGVGLVSEALLAPLLFQSGPPGRFVGGVWSIAKFLATMYFGHQLEKWLFDQLRANPSPSPARGVKKIIDDLIP